MSENIINFPLLIGIVGVVIVVIMWVKAGLGQIGVPPLVGYLGLGFGLRILNQQLNLFGSEFEGIFVFLGKIGLVTLLFRIGLESKIGMLLKQLRRASIVWLGNIFISGLFGFVAAFHLLGLTLIPSLVVATALTATSVGISVAVWENMKALQSSNGSILIDVAELDDISAVIFMAFLFAVIPALKESQQVPLGSILMSTGFAFLVKLLSFGAFCYLFSRFLERRVTKYFRTFERSPDPMLSLVGIGLIIASLAGLTGFSLAIGAFFAGLLFSRDPRAVKMDTSFLPIYELFSPFFFIVIGMSMNLNGITVAAGLGAVLLGAAVLGKFIGGGAPVFLMKDWTSGVLIGVSMIPRAEIAMVIMQQALENRYVSSQVFTGMVMVSAATCLLSPVATKSMLQRWPQKK